MARKKKPQGRRVDAKLADGYSSSPSRRSRDAGLKRRHPEREGMDFLKDAKLMVMTGWNRGRRGEHETKSISESLKAINDVLEVAAAVDRASVCILCSTLSSLLRDAAWRKHTGTTFADQLRKALNCGATVRVLVYGDPETVFPVAPSIISLLGEFGGEQSQLLQITLTGTGEYARKAFADFPHFTMSTVKNNNKTETFAHVEWDHPEDQVDWMAGDAAFRGIVFAGKDDANEPLGLLRRRFNEMFNALSEAAVASNS